MWSKFLWSTLIFQLFMENALDRGVFYQKISGPVDSNHARWFFSMRRTAGQTTYLSNFSKYDEYGRIYLFLM